MTKVDVFAQEGDELGEGPVWSLSEQALYWLDVPGRKLRRKKVGAAKAETWAWQRMPACMAERSKGGMLVVSRNELALAPSIDGPWQTIALQGGPNFADERINDGAADRKGRFWFGTFSPRMIEGVGGLWRLDPDLTVHKLDGGINMANGIAFSPDDRVLYYSDSRPGQIYSYDLSIADGRVGNRRVFHDYKGREGRPDGITVDAEGHVWVAEVTASRIGRYRPDGSLERTIAVPVPRPTSVMFGGKDLRTLFVTSMRVHMSAEELAQAPLSGAVFALEPGVAGLPEGKFGG